MIMKKTVIVFALLGTMLFPANAHADDPLVLASISPTSGDIDGGNTVTLTGSGFTEATRIRVGSSFVNDTFVSSTQITIIMPANPVGFVNVAAISGSSGPTLVNAYQYINIPDPEPTPTPTPMPTPTPEPTPETTPEPTPEPTPTPEVTPTASPSPTASAVAPAPVAGVFVSEPTGMNTPTPAVEETPQPATVQAIEFPIFTYANNVTVFTNETQMNVVVTDVFTKRLRFTLQKRVGNSWQAVAIAFRNQDGEVTFYGVPFDNGSYRIMNAGRAIKRFVILHEAAKNGP